MIYNKLVRDKIPDIISKSGKTATFRILNDEEYKIALEKKLDEEVAEFHKSKSLEEIADIIEVLCAIRAVYGYGSDETVNVRLTKNEERGGFYNKIFLVEVKEND